jgi:methyl-accepting chemotaxis protein
MTVLPVILGAMMVIWQQGFNVYVASGSLLLTGCSVGGGLFLWRRHQQDLKQLNASWVQDEITKIKTIATYTAELERLLLAISPMLSRHVMVSREHTEQEIIALTMRFTEMVNELQKMIDLTNHTLNDHYFHLDSVINTSRDMLQPVLDKLRQLHQTGSAVHDDQALLQAETIVNQTLEHLGQALTHYRDHVDAVKYSAEQIRTDIDSMLVTLQFQDRISQILTQVERNLLNLHQTIEDIQQQGDDRDGNMLQVDAAVAHIENNYKSVHSRIDCAPNDEDDITFF